MARFPILVLLFSIVLSCQNSQTSDAGTQESSAQSPNIIYIIADDLGYGDLSCYGQQKFATPNIDRLAAGGMKFTQHYSGATVCAPSRSALMTGLHTGHTYVRGNKEVKPEGQWPLPDSALTMAEILRDQGYVTGAFGKWGLGPVNSEGDPNRQGFDKYYGYNCQRLAHNYYPFHLWNNTDKVILDGNMDGGTEVYAPQKIHEEALSFIRENKDTSFFLFYPNVIPHAELLVPEEYMEKFRGKFLPEKEYKGTDDGEKFRLGPYGSQAESHAAFAGMVNLLDEQVGEVMNLVEELGISDNTLIIFTSDNGPHLEGGADPDYFDSNGPLTGYKRDLYEGGIRVPMIASWPGTIQSGSTSEHISAFWDVMPTVAELAGANTPDGIDGISFLPTLLGQPQEHHEYLYWEFHERGGRMALRKGDWKVVQYDVKKDPDGPVELYDLSDDIGEKNDLSSQHPELVKELTTLMKNARTENEVFTFLSTD